MKIIKYPFWVYCLLVLFFTSLVSQVGLSQNSTNDKTSTSLHHLPTLKIWIDSFSQGNIRSLKQHNFQSFPSIKLEEVTAAYWVQFSLRNELPIPQQYWLDTSVFDSLTLFTITDADTLVQHFGLLVVYDEIQKQQFHTLQKDKYSITIQLPPQQEQQFYLRIKNVVRFESSFENIQLHSVALYSQKPTV